jgi:hypothetical protein
VLVLVPGSFTDRETAKSQCLRKVAGEDTLDYTFMAWLKCSQPDCGEEVAITGKGSLEPHFTGEPEAWEDEDDYCTESITPLFCWPMPDMFQLPQKCPTEVKEELRAGFRLFWSDQAASAGRIRISLERLMDHFNVRKTYADCKGKVRRLDLHGRIKEFPRADAVPRKLLMALKWLGNTAVHQGSVSLNDLLDAFEILEYLLAKLFDEPSDRISELARGLLKKHDRTL